MSLANYKRSITENMLISLVERSIQCWACFQVVRSFYSPSMLLASAIRLRAFVECCVSANSEVKTVRGISHHKVPLFCDSSPQLVLFVDWIPSSCRFSLLEIVAFLFQLFAQSTFVKQLVEELISSPRGQR